MYHVWNAAFIFNYVVKNVADSDSIYYISSFVLLIFSHIFVPKGIYQAFLYVTLCFVINDYKFPLFEPWAYQNIIAYSNKISFILSNFNDFQVTFTSNSYDINKNNPLIFLKISRYFMLEKDINCLY